MAQCVKLPHFWLVNYWLNFYMNCACDAWVTNHPSHTMTIYDISGIVNLSLHLTPSPGNINAGFQVSRIYLFYMDIFMMNLGRLTLRIDLPPMWLPTVTVIPQRCRLILQDHQHLLQRKKHILLPQRTFDLFLNPNPERVRMLTRRREHCHFD